MGIQNGCKSHEKWTRHHEQRPSRQAGGERHGHWPNPAGSSRKAGAPACVPCRSRSWSRLEVGRLPSSGSVNSTYKRRRSRSHTPPRTEKKHLDKRKPLPSDRLRGPDGGQGRQGIWASSTRYMYEQFLVTRMAMATRVSCLVERGQKLVRSDHGSNFTNSVLRSFMAF